MHVTPRQASLLGCSTDRGSLRRRREWLVARNQNTRRDNLG